MAGRFEEPTLPIPQLKDHHEQELHDAYFPNPEKRPDKQSALPEPVCCLWKPCDSYFSLHAVREQEKMKAEEFVIR